MVSGSCSCRVYLQHELDALSPLRAHASWNPRSARPCHRSLSGPTQSVHLDAHLPLPPRSSYQALERQVSDMQQLEGGERTAAEALRRQIAAAHAEVDEKRARTERMRARTEGARRHRAGIEVQTLGLG